MTTEEAFSPTEAVRDRLRAVLALRPLALFSDVDGTLSAIAPTPDAATLLPGVAELLAQALTTFDLVAAVSGRTASDARQMIGLPGMLYIGNHGLEHLKEDDVTVHVRPEAEPWIRAINHVLANLQAPLMKRFPGLMVERKGVTATIHLRGVEDPQRAEGEVYKAVADAASPEGLRVTLGKMVVELRPPLQIDKGVSIENVIRTRGLRGAIYLGDDQTDIDAFRTLRRLTTTGVCQGVAVAVLHSETPAQLAAEADMTLPNAEATPGFLRWLLENVPSTS